MRFSFLSSVCLISFAISASADLTAFQDHVRREGDVLRDLEQAFQKIQPGAPYNLYSGVYEVIQYHQRLVEVVWQGANNIRRGPNISTLEAPTIGSISSEVLHRLQENMNS